MKAILAMSENRAIGLNGKIPWHVSADFKWFKEFTMNKNLVVGNTTFMNLPPLKNRNIYFLHAPRSDNPAIVPTGDYGYYKNKHGTTAKRLWYFFEVVYGIKSIDMFGTESMWKLDDPIIAGGAKTYEQFLPYITEFYVTHIKGTYDADTYMIPFEHLYNKQEVVKEFDGHRVIKYTK